MIGRLIGLPERLQEVGIVTKPSFPLNKVEKHTAVEKLQSVIVRPLVVIRLIRQIILQALENRLVAFKELVCYGFNVKGFVVTALNFKRRV